MCLTVDPADQTYELMGCSVLPSTSLILCQCVGKGESGGERRGHAGVGLAQREKQLRTNCNCVCPKLNIVNGMSLPSYVVI